MNTSPLLFTEFPKMARFARECIITEKIDGTNGQIFIYDPAENVGALEGFTSATDATGKVWNIMAGSRTRWITPANDNHSFAAWVWAHAQDLVHLGPGRHFGEWWGSGIQRGYGLEKGEKRFSLFNVQRWCLTGQEPKRIQTADPRIKKYQDVLPPCCDLVPVLARGNFEGISVMAESCLCSLRDNGSVASPGFMKPEGIVIFHVAGNVGFKRTLEKDDQPKSLA